MGKKNKNKDQNIVDETLFNLNPEEEEKKEKKQKKENKVVKTFNMYKFIFKLIACAILITFGILIWVNKDDAIGAIYLVTGIVCAFAALIRLIPLLRTLKTHRARLILFIEIVFHLLIGAYLIAAAFAHWDALKDVANVNELKGFTKFNLEAYRYILVIIFFTRSFCYYWVTIRFNEETDKVRFWLHTIINALAVVLAAIKLDPEQIVYTLIVLAFSCALVIGGEAGTGYYRYRKSIKAARQKEKEKEDSETAEIEAPAKDDNVEINEIDPNIIPVDDNNNQDSIIS